MSVYVCDVTTTAAGAHSCLCVYVCMLPQLLQLVPATIGVSMYVAATTAAGTQPFVCMYVSCRSYCRWCLQLFVCVCVAATPQLLQLVLTTLNFVSHLKASDAWDGLPFYRRIINTCQSFFSSQRCS